MLHKFALRAVSTFTSESPTDTLRLSRNSAAATSANIHPASPKHHRLVNSATSSSGSSRRAAKLSWNGERELPDCDMASAWQPSDGVRAQESRERVPGLLNPTTKLTTD